MLSLMTIRGFLKGFKTYIIVGMWFLMLALEKVFGMDVAGFDAGSDWLETSFNYILVATGRAALSATNVETVLDRLIKTR